MVRLQERHFWMGLVLGWLLLAAMAQLLAGCGDPLAAAPQACAPGEVASEGGGCAPRKPCAPGELTLESGECQPAGLPPDMQCPPGELALANGGCQSAGLPPDMQCPPGELALANGGCQPAGVPPEACAEGFVPDGNGGCEPILPAKACPWGLMAIPGETICREVAPCGDGSWGTIPVEANTQFVDQAYAGGDSDGSAARPWTRVQDGVDAAEDGAIVAVTDGTYVEDVLIQDKAVRLWGRCPGRVEIQGTEIGSAAILIRASAASGSAIRRLSTSGAEHGMTVSGATDVTIEAVWVHGAARRGIEVEDTDGPTSAVLTGSLIEQNHEEGIFVWGAHAEIVGTVVRSTQPVNGQFGRGIGIQDDPETGVRAGVSILSSLIEQNHDTGVLVWGSDADVRGTVIRTTQPVNAQYGTGIEVLADANTGAHAGASIDASVIEQNHERGVFVAGADVVIVNTVVRYTMAANGKFGVGIEIIHNFLTDERADARVHACLVEENHEYGIYVEGSDAKIEAVIVRSTQPVSGEFGDGIGIQDHPQAGERADVRIHACLVEQNHGSGIMVSGADAEIEYTVARSTQPVNGKFGRGISIQDNDASGERANVSVRACLVEQNHNTGVFVGGSDATIEGTIIRSTQPVNGLFGRGIAIQDDPVTGERADVSIRACLVEENQEVGVFAGGSSVEIEGAVVRSTQPLDGQGGRGIVVQANPVTGVRAEANIRACLVEENHEMGVLASGARVEIERTTIRSTQPVNGQFGRGVAVQDDPETGQGADLRMRSCLVEKNHEIGVLVVSAHAEIELTVVRATRPIDGYGGSGIAVMARRDAGGRADAMIRSCLVEKNQRIGLGVETSDATIEDTAVRDTGAESDEGYGDGIAITYGSAAIVQRGEVTGNSRAGIANWGAEVKIISTLVACNKVDLNGEAVDGVGASFNGSNDWSCSRVGAENCRETVTCSVESASIGPPPPLEPLEPLDPLPPS